MTTAYSVGRTSVNQESKLESKHLKLAGGSEPPVASRENVKTSNAAESLGVCASAQHSRATGGPLLCRARPSLLVPQHGDPAHPEC